MKFDVGLALPFTHREQPHASPAFDTTTRLAVKLFQSRTHPRAPVSTATTRPPAPLLTEEQFHGQSRRTRQREEETQEGRGQEQRTTAARSVQAGGANTNARAFTSNDAKVNRTQAYISDGTRLSRPTAWWLPLPGCRCG